MKKFGTTIKPNMQEVVKHAEDLLRANNASPEQMAKIG